MIFAQCTGPDGCRTDSVWCHWALERLSSGSEKAAKYGTKGGPSEGEATLPQRMATQIRSVSARITTPRRTDTARRFEEQPSVTVRLCCASQGTTRRGLSQATSHRTLSAASSERRDRPCPSPTLT